MAGCLWCKECKSSTTNKRDEVIPCIDKWTCQIYMKNYNREKEARKMEAERRQRLWDSQAATFERYQKYAKKRR